MSAPRVLVLSCSAGHGHVMAARAVATSLRRRHPAIDVSELDAVKKMSGWFGRTYEWSYVKLADRAPLVWRAVYDQTNRRRSALGHFAARVAGRSLVRACVRWQPHVILTTHFLGAEVLSGVVRQGKLDASLQVVVTDHDFHRMWYWPEVERYFVASDLVKARIHLKYGVPQDQIQVTGIPVRRRFTVRHDLGAVRARLGLDPARPVVLFMSGGFAPGPIRQSILGLWMERRDVQVLAVCGRNERLRRAIAALPRPAGAALHALGFVADPSELIAVADLVVTKGGGITTAECLAVGRPVVISETIPGQEERNADVLVEAGVAVKALTPEEVRWRVGQLLGDPTRLKAMRKAARAFGRPQAANEIADAVAEDITEPAVFGPHFHGARAPAAYVRR